MVGVDTNYHHSFSDHELAALRDLPQLVSLEVAETNITSVSAANIQNCPGLMRLDLSSTNIDDSCLVYVSRLKALRFLQISDCPITDEGIAKLWSSRNLDVVALHGTSVTDHGAQQLARNLPNCKVAFTTKRPEPIDKSAVPPNPGDLLPDREVTAFEQNLLLEKSHLLVSKRATAENFSAHELDLYNVDRRRAADSLGQKLRHRSAIPALAAVFRDPTDDPKVRSAAAHALSYIADPLAVEVLIGAISEGDEVGLSAEFSLIRMMHVGVGRKPADGYTELTEAERLERQRQWRAWWERNKDRFALKAGIGSVEVWMSEEEWEASLSKPP